MRVFISLVISMMLMISFMGCNRQETGNVTTETTLETPQETQASQETSTAEVGPTFDVKQDIAKNIFGKEGDLKANKTIIIGPATLQETVVTDDLQSSIDFLRKGYKDLDSIADDYPDMLSTKVVDEFGQVKYRLSDKLKLAIYGSNTIVLESQAIQIPINDIKIIPELNLIHAADYIILTDAQGEILRAYLSNNRYEQIHYGDFLGDDTPELAFIYYDAMDTHFFNLNGDTIEPIDLNALYHEIDTQTQAILDDRSFEVKTFNNPNSSVISMEDTQPSVLPEKLYLNMAGGTLNDAPYFKLISSVIEKETMKAALSCRWMWTNGLQGDIALAEVGYVFVDNDVARVIQKKVDMRYRDQSLVNRAFDYSEVIIKKDDTLLIDTTAPMKDQLQYFALEKPFVVPEASGNMELKQHYFERLGISLDITYFDDMLTHYTLKLTSADYSLGDSFKIGMSKDEVISLMGMPDLVNDRTLFEDTAWSYYVKTESGERLLNFYYGHKKVIFVFDDDFVKEIRVKVFSSPT